MSETTAQRLRRLAAELREEAQLPSPFGRMATQSEWRNICRRRANLYDAQASRIEEGRRR